MLSWVRRALWDVVPRDHREPSTALRRRQLTVLSVAVVGAVVLGFSLRVEPGSTSFYWWTLALAGVWVVAAIAAGPLHLGRISYRSGYARPIVTPIVVGLVLVALFVLGGLVVREIPALDAQVRHVLVLADEGVLSLVVLVTAVNGYRRGTLLPRRALRRRHPPLGRSHYRRQRARSPRGGQPDADLRRGAPRGRRGPGATGLRRDPRPDPYPRNVVGVDAVRAAAAVRVSQAERGPSSRARRTTSAYGAGSAGTSSRIDSSVTSTSVLIESMRLRPVVTSMSVTSASQ